MAINAPKTATANDYDWSSSGIDNFLQRSIEQVQWQSDLNAWLNIPGGSTASLSSVPAPVQTTGSNSAVNLNQSPTTGQLGSTMTVGDIQLNGTDGNITTTDNSGNVQVVLGNSSTATGGF